MEEHEIPSLEDVIKSLKSPKTAQKSVKVDENFVLEHFKVNLERIPQLLYRFRGRGIMDYYGKDLAPYINHDDFLENLQLFKVERHAERQKRMEDSLAALQEIQALFIACCVEYHSMIMQDVRVAENAGSRQIRLESMITPKDTNFRKMLYITIALNNFLNGGLLRTLELVIGEYTL